MLILSLFKLISIKLFLFIFYDDEWNIHDIQVFYWKEINTFINQGCIKLINFWTFYSSVNPEK